MDVQSPRPGTVAKTDFNFWSEEKIMNTKSNKNLPKLKIEVCVFTVHRVSALIMILFNI